MVLTLEKFAPGPSSRISLLPDYEGHADVSALPSHADAVTFSVCKCLSAGIEFKWSFVEYYSHKEEAQRVYGLYQSFQNVIPRTSSIRITWEVEKKQIVGSHPWRTESHTEAGTQQFVFP